MARGTEWGIEKGANAAERSMPLLLEENWNAGEEGSVENILDSLDRSTSECSVYKENPSCPKSRLCGCYTK